MTITVTKETGKLKGVTHRNAVAVFNELRKWAVKKGFTAEEFADGATLRADDNGWINGRRIPGYYIMWEEGPEGWAYNFATTNKTVRTEAACGWGLVGIYGREDY